MRNRRLLLWLAGVALIGLGVWIVAGALRPRHNISQAGFELIRAGMTEREVETILGGPAGDYTHGRVDPSECIPSGEWLLDGKEWVGNESIVTVAFDEEGKVLHAQIREVPHLPSLWQRLRNLLPW
jgi:hypothetical protein